jgi:hypothetical protein
MSPLELLQKQLHSFEKNIVKSKEAFDKGLIDKETHETHIENNTPRIQEYKDAIQTLIIFGK